MTPPPGAEVALAVVTGPRGVLLIERADRTPPLAFPGGKIELDETPQQAAAREVLEETGVHVRCSRTLGERTHPETGVRVVYLESTPISGAALNPDHREVAAAAWWPASSVLARLGPHLHAEVRAHLALRA